MASAPWLPMRKESAVAMRSVSLPPTSRPVTSATAALHLASVSSAESEGSMAHAWRIISAIGHQTLASP